VQVKVEVKQGRVLLLSGPASITLLQGQAQVLGAQLGTGQRIVLRGEARLPIEVAVDAAFDLSPGHSARCEELPTSTIPDQWRDIVRSVSEMGNAKAVIVGPTDVGKSTFVTLLTNNLVIKPRPVNVIDGDIGQADLGPPTTVAMASAREPTIRLADLSPSRWVFVGFTSPSVLPTKVISSLKKLCDAAGKGCPSVINTDGWVLNEAVGYKADLIAALDPDIVIGIGDEKSVGPILGRCGRKTIRVAPSGAARERSKEERRSYREYRYRAFLENASYLTVRYTEVDVLDFKGNTLPLESLNGYRSNIAGALDREGWLKGIGILRGVDAKDRKLTIFSRERSVSALEVGLVPINEDGRELSD